VNDSSKKMQQDLIELRNNQEAMKGCVNIFDCNVLMFTDKLGHQYFVCMNNSVSIMRNGNGSLPVPQAL
jgi:hypothetical protein